MSDEQLPSMGDNVRILDAEETRTSGHAGLVGVCMGFTTPAATGVTVVGGSRDTIAWCVTFDDGTDETWFNVDVIQVIDHAPGTEMTIGGNRLVRRADGGWDPA